MNLNMAIIIQHPLTCVRAWPWEHWVVIPSSSKGICSQLCHCKGCTSQSLTLPSQTSTGSHFLQLTSKLQLLVTHCLLCSFKALKTSTSHIYDLLCGLKAQNLTDVLCEHCSGCQSAHLREQSTQHPQLCSLAPSDVLRPEASPTLRAILLSSAR